MSLADVLDEVVRERATRRVDYETVSLDEVLQVIRHGSFSRFSGTITLHIQSGQLVEVNIPVLVRIRIAEPLDRRLTTRVASEG